MINGNPAAVGESLRLSSGAILQVNADGTFRYDPNGSFDHLSLGEPSEQDTFTYTITDDLGVESTATVTMSIDGINDAPTEILISGNSVATDAMPNQVVGRLTTIDPDRGDTHVYALISDDSGAFGISGADLVVANPSNLTVGTHFVVVRTTDQHCAASLSHEQLLQIIVREAPDTIAPSSSIAALPANPDDLIIPITVSGVDHGANGGEISGIKEYRLYVSEDAGEFALFATLPATELSSELSTEFIAISNRNYFFRSIAVDNAGNVESKTGADTQISIGDFDAPETNVVSAVANSLGLFNVTMIGRDTGGGTLAFFDIYVSVDNGVAQLIGTTGGGAPDTEGNYHGSVPYQGRTDGASYTYRFFSIGRDSTGNVEAVPRSRTSDIRVTATFADLGLQATGIDVQQGATQRSFIRTVDVLFNSEIGLNDLLADGRVAVERFAPDATNVDVGTGVPVTDFSIERIRDRLRLDFDVDGVTSELGNSNPTNNPAGDGFYRVMVDTNGDGDFTDDGIDSYYHFHRLLGDANGDGVVSGDISPATGDLLIIETQNAQSGENLDGDINGDGTVNSTDFVLTDRQRRRNARLDAALIALLDD